MKKAIILGLAFAATVAHAQIQFPYILNPNVDPSGTACVGVPQLQVYQAGNKVDYCGSNNLWDSISGGGGSGTVTSVTGTPNQIDVATGTTTPVLSLDPALILPTGTTLVAPILGTPASGVITNLTGTCTACTANAVTTIPGAINPQTATYQVLASDFSGYKTIAVASGTFTITLVASGTQPANGQFINIVNYGTGVVTIARSGQNINGGTTSILLGSASAAATNPQFATIWSDGTNYFLYGLLQTINVNGVIVGSALRTIVGVGGTAFSSDGMQPTTDISFPLGQATLRWSQIFIGPTGLKLGNGTNGPTITTTGTTPNENLVLTGAGTGTVAIYPGHYVASGQTSATTAQTLVTTTATSTYQINAVVTCDTTVAAATVTLTIAYTDPSSTAQTVTPSAAVCTTLGASSSANVTQTIRAKTGTTITAAAAISGSPNYDIAATAMQITVN